MELAAILRFETWPASVRKTIARKNEKGQNLTSGVDQMIDEQVVDLLAPGSF